jgi:hypothetical protein
MTLTRFSQIPVTDKTRAIMGFGMGCLLMLLAVRIFVVNHYDFDNMQRGIRLLLQGVNPWTPATRIPDFYNPPFAVLFLWPMLFATPKIYLVLGGGALFAFAFYQRAWVALAWFATNTVLWLIAAGGIDMFVIGVGLLLLLAGDNPSQKWLGLFWRVLAYGLLMVKPQGGVFIVALYILTRRDWKGLLLSIFIYGVLFLPLYPAWLSVLLNDPPLAQTEAAHTLMAKFGPLSAGIIAGLVLVSRKWKYWQLGGVLAGIVAPYGMPGLPIFLTLTSVRTWVAIPIVVIYSGALAALTWIHPPPDVDFYTFMSPLMAIYHLSMLGLALTLACLSQGEPDADSIAVGDWIKERLPLPRSKTETVQHE